MSSFGVACRRRGLSAVHGITLGVLAAKGRMYMTELADSQEVSTAAATGIVDRMELRGVVRRDRPKEDRRKVYVELTEKGRVVLREILAAAGLREDSDLADISDRGDLSDSDGADEIPEEMAGAVAGDPELERAPWERWGICDERCVHGATRIRFGCLCPASDLGRCGGPVGRASPAYAAGREADRVAADGRRTPHEAVPG